MNGYGPTLHIRSVQVNIICIYTNLIIIRLTLGLLLPIKHLKETDLVMQNLITMSQSFVSDLSMLLDFSKVVFSRLKVFVYTSKKAPVISLQPTGLQHVSGFILLLYDMKKKNDVKKKQISTNLPLHLTRSLTKA